MASRDAVVRALTELRTWFPAMPDSESLIEATRRGLEEYDDEEVRVAATRITRERKRLQGAPSLADLREMCAAVAGVRRADAVRHQRADSSDAYCPLCNTRTLTWGPLWPNGKSRLVPLHERECVRCGVEELVSPPVNMARWPGGVRHEDILRGRCEHDCAHRVRRHRDARADLSRHPRRATSARERPQPHARPLLGSATMPTHDPDHLDIVGFHDGARVHSPTKALMPDECMKARERRLRDPNFATHYFVGHGLDVGGGSDGLGAQAWPGMLSCRTWDMPDGDAQFLESVPAAAYEFVHSSHCLEHMVDPLEALAHWVRVCKPGGYIVVLIPDEDMYEQGVFPSTFNGDHKWTFTPHKVGSWSRRSINVLSMIQRLGGAVECVKVESIHGTYNWQADTRHDQTGGPAECAIEIILRKRTAQELTDGGRFAAWHPVAP